MLMDSIATKAPAEISPDLARRLSEEKKRMAAKLGQSRCRRVLLIGGSGYIGGPLTTHLLSMGYEVTNLDLLVYRQGSVSLSHMAHPGYRFVIGDMGHAPTLERALEGVTDVVILAGLVGDPITKKYPEDSATINDVSVRKCINQLNDKGLERVVFISTCSNYGLTDGDELVDEESPLAPLSLYAKSKVAAEKHILSLKGQVDYQPTILRFATAFGLSARMRFDLTVNEFTRELYLGHELVVYDADSWRPYCHVKDFATLIGLVLAFPAEDVAFEVFNAGSDENNHTKRSIVDLILNRLPDRKVEYNANSSDKRNYRVDFSKARNHLSFQPRYSVADGIDEVIWAMKAGLLDNVDILPNLHGNYTIPGLESRTSAEAASHKQLLAQTG